MHASGGTCKALGRALSGSFDTAKATATGCFSFRETVDFWCFGAGRLASASRSGSDTVAVTAPATHVADWHLNPTPCLCRC